MGNILHLITFADPDDVSEIVLDDSQVIAMVVDVRRKQQGVTSTHDALLAQIGSAPVDFQTQLIRLDDFWRLGKPLSKLCEERHVAMRRRLVVDEGRVGELTRSALGSVLDERSGARIVPGLLCIKFARGDDEQRESSDRNAKPHGGKLVAGEPARRPTVNGFSVMMR